MPVSNRVPIIGVMGSGSHSYETLTHPLGQWIAQQGFHLLTGGGQGVMASVSEAFCLIRPRKGLCIGIIPASADFSSSKTPDGYPNSFIEIPIFTHLSARGGSGREAGSRNHINILSSNVLVILPGGLGTKSETELALHYEKPSCAFGNARDFQFAIPGNVPRFNELSEVQNFIQESLS